MLPKVNACSVHLPTAGNTSPIKQASDSSPEVVAFCLQVGPWRINYFIISLTIAFKLTMVMEKQGLPSIIGFGWELLRRREGRKRVLSLKLQLFCTLVGLPSAVMSVLGDLLSPIEACLLLILWPLGLAMRTRSLKLSFWLWTTEAWLFHFKQFLLFHLGKYFDEMVYGHVFQ